MLAISTPEGIVFSYLLAGPSSRFLAWLIDVLCIAALVAAAVSLIEGFALVAEDLAGAVLIASYFLISIGYGIATEWWWRGQTVGKKLFQLRVIDAHGLRLQPAQIVIRNLLRFIDSLPAFYLVGGLACMITNRCQRLGDLAAGTVVVRIPKLAEPDLEQIMAGKYNSFREHPHLEARLRQKVSAAEASVILRALLRRDELDSDARAELFRDLATHFRSIASFPEDLTHGLTDEQYVRNVADSVFRKVRDARQ